MTLDIILANIFIFNYKYHAKTSIDKFRPTSVGFVL